jgi:prefoldin alpha subunit
MAAVAAAPAPPPSAAGPAPAPDDGSVPVTALSPQELQELRARLQRELESLSGSAQQLARLAGAFGASQRAIQALDGSAKEGQRLLLPLTSSVYVSGEVAAPHTVLVDVGTGYYVEMAAEDGAAYCRRKQERLRASLREVERGLAQRRDALGQVQAVLGDKLRRQQQQVEAQQQLEARQAAQKTATAQAQTQGAAGGAKKK